MVGGPPCQGFSALGLQNPDDPRNQLWRHYLETLVKVRPAFFVLENVPQFLKSAEFGLLLAETNPGGSLAGYELDYAVFNAADFGAAQSRRRAVVVGRPRGARTVELDAFRTERHTLRDVVPVWMDGTVDRTELPDSAVPFRGALVPGAFKLRDIHITRRPTQLSLDRYRAIPPGGNRTHLPDHLKTPCWRRHSTGAGDVMGRLVWAKPSVTIRTEFFKPEKGRYLHPDQDRPITHAEAASIQGFPESYALVWDEDVHRPPDRERRSAAAGDRDRSRLGRTAQLTAPLRGRAGSVHCRLCGVLSGVQEMLRVQGTPKAVSPSGRLRTRRVSSSNTGGLGSWQHLNSSSSTTPTRTGRRSSTSASGATSARRSTSPPGHFEIGAFLALDGAWQKVDKIRLLIGGETSRTTADAIAAALDTSIVVERQTGDPSSPGSTPSSTASAAARSRSGSTSRRSSTRRPTSPTASSKVVGSAALVGSSNFTRPGLTQNVELNVRFQGPEVVELQEWYEKHWDEATPVNAELLSVLEHNAREFTPFEVYAKALHALTANVDPTDKTLGGVRVGHLPDARALPAGGVPRADRDVAALERRIPHRRRRSRARPSSA